MAAPQGVMNDCLSLGRHGDLSLRLAVRNSGRLMRLVMASTAQ